MMAGNQSVNAPAGIAAQPNSCREAPPQIFGPPAKCFSLIKEEGKNMFLLARCT